MSRASLLVALAAGLLLAAGVLLSRAVVGANGDELSSAARIDVDAGVRVAPVGDLLGAVVNENYWRADDPLHPDWHDDYLGRTVDRVRALAPINGRRFALRFGHSPTDGSWGKDGYHWLDALDPAAWSTSIDEFLDYASAVNGEPYVAVNFGSGTAAEAASLVAYTNGVDESNEFVRLRIQRGRAKPYGVRDWILGFEQYAPWETGYQADRDYDFANPGAANGGDPEWYGRPSSNPADFAARAAQYAREMRAASPTPIRIYTPLNNWDLAYWGGPEESVGTLLRYLGGVVDGVAVHFYPANSGYGESDEDLLGRPESLAGKLDLLRGLLARHGPRGKRLDIADVEYNNRSGTNGQTRQLVNGLFVADTLRVLATRGVASAFYFAISTGVGSSSGFSYFENGDVARPMPTFLATRLLAQHLGAAVVASEVSRGKMVTAPGGASGQFSYPSLTSLASLSPDGKTLYLVVVNKHLVYDQKAEIYLRGAAPAGKAHFALLNGPSAQSTADEVSLSESTLPVGPTFTHTFPAHSVTGIRIPLY